MRKLALFMLTATLFVACNTKTPEQQAEEDFKKHMQELEQNQAQRSIKMDSLVNVATGLSVETYETAKRNQALKVLREEYPELSERWDAVQKSIDNMEVY